MTLEATTLSVAVACDWRVLYEAIWRPEAFAGWASGLGTLVSEDDRWIAQGPAGPVSIRFSPHNAFGIMDHWVELGGAETSTCRCASSPTAPALR